MLAGRSNQFTFLESESNVVPGYSHGYKSQGSLGHLVDSRHRAEGQRVSCSREMRTRAHTGPAIGLRCPSWTALLALSKS